MDVLELDAIGQAEAIKRGDISPKELLDLVMERISQVNPEINSVCYTNYERALARAGQGFEGPFAGVPFLVKDLLPVPRFQCSFGSRLFANYFPDQGSPFTHRLEQAGLNILGVTTSSEFGLLGSTETKLYGPTKNPLDKKLSAGGSSGGAAAAVASGMVPMAHASDGGGSIRIPASICGLFGFKPSRGRNVSSLLMPEPYPLSLLVDHCISRSVRDSACLLSVMENHDGPYVPLGFITKARGKKFKIAYFEEELSDLGKDAHLVLEKTKERCRSLGHELVTIQPPRIDKDLIGDAFFTFSGASLDGVEKMMAEVLPEGLGSQHLEPFSLW